MMGHGTDATGGAARQRKIRRGGWTKAKQRDFIDVLAMTANVPVAAASVEMNKSGAY